jgi:hypothetical protein
VATPVQSQPPPSPPNPTPVLTRHPTAWRWVASGNGWAQRRKAARKRIKTRTSGLVKGSQSKSARALRAASSSASRAATFGLLGARPFDDLVDRGREVLVRFLGRAGDGGGRDREVAGQVGGALLELGAPFAVGGPGGSEGQLEETHSGALAGSPKAGLCGTHSKRLLRRIELAFGRFVIAASFERSRWQAQRTQRRTAIRLFAAAVCDQPLHTDNPAVMKLTATPRSCAS